MGRPRAKWVTLTSCRGRWRRMYIAVASPSNVGLVAITNSSTSSVERRENSSLKLEPVGPYTVYGRDGAVKHVVQPPEAAGLPPRPARPTPPRRRKLGTGFGGGRSKWNMETDRTDSGIPGRR